MEKKHLVYAEDVVYEIMQHPSKNISKGLVKMMIDKVVAEHEVKQHSPYVIMGNGSGAAERERMREALEEYLKTKGAALSEDC